MTSPSLPAVPPVVVALGGNALIRPGEEGTAAEQAARVAEVAGPLADLAAAGPLVITHGNGPQVGRHLLRSDLLRDRVPPTTLELAVAATQAEIGWMIQQAVDDELRRRGQPRPVVTLVTRVRVDPADPAFLDPTKYVGRFYDEGQAKALAAELGWRVRRDGDRGWRRVVSSPQPQEVLEAEVVRTLTGSGAVVIACGGGGVPVVDLGDRLAGVEAVIDKDLASALLATQLGAGRLIVLTAVDRVWQGFGTPQGRPLETVAAATLRALLAAGEFPAGSMGPKIEAALGFLDRGGQEVLITSPEALHAAIQGKDGTHVHA
ncbi:carbamate kinase [Myxococcota bacterium]|nr:carbamate kinase [Myxococcota bacterium]